MVLGRWRRTQWLVVIAVVASAGLALAQEKPLDNAEIVKLTKLEMGDAIIVAKIRSSREVNFATSTDDLIKLKEAGVSRAVIAAMLERLTPAAPAAGAAKAAPAEAEVTLYASGGGITLSGAHGEVKTKASPFSVAKWIQFHDAAAKIRTVDRRPSLVIATDKDPRGAWWVVSVGTYKDSGEEVRYFDLEAGGWISIDLSGSPDKGAIVKYEVSQEQPGLWRLTLLKDLKPGEYGLFTGAQGGGLLFGFGVAK
jgi:hypothetical protein